MCHNNYSSLTIRRDETKKKTIKHTEITYYGGGNIFINVLIKFQRITLQSQEKYSLITYHFNDFLTLDNCLFSG